MALTARSENELAATAAECGPDALVVPADITEPGAVDRIFEAVEAAYAAPDVLVANAGGAVTGAIGKITDADWQHMLDLNLTAPFRCVRRALPAMVQSQWGRIVAIGSVASRQGAPYIASYVAAKHGLLGLVRATAAEVVRTGVTVNAVCPGFVDSPMTDASVANIVEATGRTPALHLAEDDREVMLTGDPLDAADDLERPFALELVEDHLEERRPAARPGRPLVAVLADRGLDPRPRLGGDVFPTVDDLRDGRNGDPGHLRDVRHRRRIRPTGARLAGRRHARSVANQARFRKFRHHSSQASAT